MAFKKIILQPGFDTQKTQTLNSESWSFADLVRWKNGLLEKMGGWQRLINQTLTGKVRGLHAFQDLSSITYLAAGSNERLQLYTGGQLYDITPIRATVDITPAFTTTTGSSHVDVTDTSNGANSGDWINIVVQIAVGGIVLVGYYKIIAVIDADNYTIEVNVLALSDDSGGATPVFTTINTSDVVTVTLTNHGFTIGDPFPVPISTSVGGLTIEGAYIVDTVVDADNFTIRSASGASSDDSASENNGDAEIEYLLPSGYPSDTPISGWGGGAWGEGGWGIGTSTPSAIIPLRNWYLDNFGENLVALYTNGTLYEWIPPIAPGNVATPVSAAPDEGTAMFVAMPQAQVVILGAETGSTQDPLLVRWSDNGDYNVWIATSTNQAGSYRLSRGSRIIGGIQAPQSGLIWTDLDLWLMQYIQPPFIYGFNIIGNNCGMIASKACTILGNAIIWVSQKGFFLYSGSGGVQPLPCSVWDVIFRNLDPANTSKVFMGSNSLFNEAMAFFPSESGGSGEIDSYVKFNIAENLWDYGNLIRTAWIDYSIIGNPIGVDETNFMQQHEVGQDADGVAMETSAESGYMDVASGEMFIFLNWMIPDFILPDESQITITLYAVDFPDGPQRTYGPYTVTNTTQYINVRARARQIAIKIESNTLGTFWRFGAFRYRGAASGRV